MINNELPFVTEPAGQKITTVGNATIGTLQFEKKGDLTVGESLEVEQWMRELTSPFTLASKLAVRISQERGIPDVEFSFDIVTSTCRSTDEASIKLFNTCRILYAEEISKLNYSSEDVAKYRQMSTVSAVIRNRLDLPNWDRSEIKLPDGSFTTIRHLNDTKGLRNKLYQAIWRFIESEIGDEQVQNLAPTAEQIKKPQAGTENPSNQPTGETSSGEFRSSGLMTGDF